MIHPKKYVQIKPIPNQNEIGLKITSRSLAPNYKCEYPPRSVRSKDNYERRKYQLQQCGYQSPISKPYQEVGEVILDSKELVLKALYQDIPKTVAKDQELSSDEEDFIEKLENEDRDLKTHPPLLHYDKKKLSTINQEIKLQKCLLTRVRQGMEMSKILKERQENEAMKKLKEERDKKRKQREETNLPESDTDTEDEEERDLSRYIVQMQASGSQFNITNKINNSTSIQTSSISVSSSDSIPERIESNQNLGDSKAKNSKEKKLFRKRDRPRPFSPIYTNINFYSVTSNEALFRQLCVLNWILEAMSQDKNPPVMMFVTSSWKFSNLKQDQKTMQKRLDREKLADPIWNAFITNPSRFQAKSQRSRFQGKRKSISMRMSATNQQFLSKYNESIQDDSISNRSDCPSRRSSITVKMSANEQAFRLAVKFAEETEAEKKKFDEKVNFSQENWQKLQDSFNKKLDMGDIVQMKMKAEKKSRTSKELENFNCEMKDKFSELKKHQDIVLHDQLELRDRTRWSSYEKKFLSLRVVNHLYEDLENWRKETNKSDDTEQTTTNINIKCPWYDMLASKLSENVKNDEKFAIIMRKIKKFTSLEGRKISATHFIRSLSLLRPFELCHPDISAAIEFVRDKIVGMEKETFEHWCRKHVSKEKRITSAPPKLKTK